MKKNEENINVLLSKVLKHYNLEHKYQLVSLKHKWPDIVGNMVSENTIELKITEKVLIVGVNSAALRSELQFHKSLIVTKVNDFFKQQIIQEVKIYS